MKSYLFLLVTMLFFACNSTHQLPQIQDIPKDGELKKYSKSDLLTDFDLLVNSLKEAHAGLYWYATESQFDSMVQIQKKIIKDSLNGIDFYNIVAPIIAFTKEDHCNISLSKEAAIFLEQEGTFIPIIVRSLNKDIYILNNHDTHEMKGWLLKEINGQPIADIYQTLFKTFASDGFIESSKYRWLDDRRFSYYYSLVFGMQPACHLTVEDPVSKDLKTIELPMVSRADLSKIRNIRDDEKFDFIESHPGSLAFIDNSTAILTINTFSNSDYKQNKMKFERFVSRSFQQINELKIDNLIIDIRENGGGNEGNEDYLFSYLTNKTYNKYKYVECSAYTYSFLEYTNFSKPLPRKFLKWILKREHYTTSNGQIMRKQRFLKTAPLKDNSFTGNTYILTSGWTYSGGAEFSSLMKQHTNAIFIGEEVGGGYYGNTSGLGLELTLPNTKTVIDIPILKFVLDVNGVEFGRGVIPDYPIQPTIDEFLNGYDTEMEFAKQLIH